MRSGALALYKAAGSTAVLRAASCSVNRFLAGIAGSEQCQPAPATSSSAIRASLVGPINLRGFAAVSC